MYDGSAAQAKTILFVIDTLEVGGTERSLLDIAGRLDPSRFRPIVCRLYPGETLQAEFERAGIEVVSCELPGKYSFLRGVRKLRSFVREKQPDLIHTMLFRADQVGRVAGAVSKIPVVSSFVGLRYDPIRFSTCPTRSRWKSSLQQTLDWLTARTVTRFHAVSHAVRDSNCRHLRVSGAKVAIIPRGRSLAQTVDTQPSTMGELRRSLGLEGARPLLLNVGRLSAEKGQADLIRAMARLTASLPSARMAVAGEGTLKKELADLTRRLALDPYVSFLGYRRDIPDLLRACDVFVFPSLHEGLPGAVIEAMMAGRAIVASNIPEVAELIQDGESGLLVPPRNPLRLAEAILRVAADSEFAARLGANARRVACQRYDIDIVVRQMEAFYDCVLTDHGHSHVEDRSILKSA